MRDSLEARVSISVRHDVTGEIVAAIIANDLHSTYMTHPCKASSSPEPFAVLDLFSELDDIFIRHDLR
jgi:hypothetical protein